MHRPEGDVEGLLGCTVEPLIPTNLEVKPLSVHFRLEGSTCLNWLRAVHRLSGGLHYSCNWQDWCRWC
eukprot:8289976-Lingulodinium_polyedra.AAC.1